MNEYYQIRKTNPLGLNLGYLYLLPNTHYWVMDPNQAKAFMKIEDAQRYIDVFNAYYKGLGYDYITELVVVFK